MGDTSISWTDKTWPVSRGCLRVSEGCRNCYAQRQANRFSAPGKPFHGYVTSKLKVIDDDDQFVDINWTGKVSFLPDMLREPMRWKKPCRVFVNSMSDLFHDDLTNEQIAAVFGVMAACPQHQFQVLTKRSKRMREWFAWAEREGAHEHVRVFLHIHATQVIARHYRCPFIDAMPQFDGRLHAVWPIPNVWIGVSVEDQDAADERIPDLLSAPAAIRFLSCEPLLGPVDLFHIHHGNKFYNVLDGSAHTDDGSRFKATWRDLTRRIDWVIVGCESGPRARACDYRWIRRIRDQVVGAGRPLFLKQAKSCLEHDDELGISNVAIRRPKQFVIAGGPNAHKKGGGVFERPYLDGRQHLSFPA